MVGASIDLFDVAFPALIHQVPADILHDIITEKYQGSKMSAHERNQSRSYFCPGTERDNVTVARNSVNKHLRIREPTVSRIESVGTDTLCNACLMQMPDDVHLKFPRSGECDQYRRPKTGWTNLTCLSH